MLTVLSVAYGLAPAGPDAVGGAEQVLSSIDRALVQHGYRSIVIAAEGSHVAGELFPVPQPRSAIDEAVRRRVREWQRQRIRESLASRPIDLVHMHGLDFYDYLPPPGVPVVVTLHMPLDWYSAASLQPDRADTHLCCVSRAQRTRGPEHARSIPVIPNGVEPPRTQPAHKTVRRYVLALGRICPEKGFHHALDAAHAANVPMLLSGKVFPYPDHIAYFEREIVPRLDDRRRFIGSVSLRQKVRLLRHARCLLIPSLAPETSSLVAMEAMFCGTPVIAFAAGALPDIVSHGVSGFVVSDVAEMIAAIRCIAEIDPVDCVTLAEQRFTARRMIEQYFALYSSLAPQGSVQHVA